MKTDYTSTVSEIIQFEKVNGPVCKPIAKTEYYSDTQSTWVALDEIESRR